MLAALGANGPLLPFTSTSGCCGAARRTGLSCICSIFLAETSVCGRSSHSAASSNAKSKNYLFGIARQQA
jgi:hypothetical protein